MRAVTQKPAESSGIAATHLRLGASDRERLRSALHDGLGQSLTSIAFLASALQQTLSGKQLPEASQAGEILSLTVRAISETQALVREDEPEA